MVKTMETVKRIRPKASWGFYMFPYKLHAVPPQRRRRRGALRLRRRGVGAQGLGALHSGLAAAGVAGGRRHLSIDLSVEGRQRGTPNGLREGPSAPLDLRSSQSICRVCSVRDLRATIVSDF